MKNTVSGNEARGFMKIIVASDTDTVVGIHMIGPDCAEIMQVIYLSALLCYDALETSTPSYSSTTSFPLLIIPLL